MLLLCAFLSLQNQLIPFLDSDSSSTHNSLANEDLSSSSHSGQTLQVFKQNIPSHLLMVALLEHICYLYGNNETVGKKICQGQLY